MGEVSDVLDLIHKATRSGPEALNKFEDIRNMRGKSITRGAKDSTFQFPCLITLVLQEDNQIFLLFLLQLIFHSNNA